MEHHRRVAHKQHRNDLSQSPGIFLGGRRPVKCDHVQSRNALDCISQTLDAASVPRPSYKYKYKYQSSSQVFQFHYYEQHRSWETTTRGQPPPWTLLLRALYILDRSNVSNQLRNHSGRYVLSTHLPSRLEARHLRLTASRRSRLKGRKKTCTPIEGVGHVSAYHHRRLCLCLCLCRALDPSSRSPFQCLPMSYFPRLLLVFFRHPPRHGSTLSLISLTFASSMIILNTLPVGTSMLSAAPSTAALRRTRHT